MSKYGVNIDRKWQKKWEETKLYKFNKDRVDKKLYCLEMFSYPSGSKLHVGHWYNYGVTDSWARLKRLQGYEVFQPMGFDAFGLPAENYAIKTGIHPQDSTLENIRTMEIQLRNMGAMFDWDYEIITCNPDYYKWTQWIFLKLYEKGLAYRKEAPVNWCPDCNTVLANEQVVNGLCERCSSEVTKKNLTQWFFKITEYAEELLEKLDQLDWPEKTKLMQKNWIGKSEGAQITFKIKGSEETFEVFTTRPDTLFGVTYVVLAPENPLVDKITTPKYKELVEEYQEKTKKLNEIDRLATTHEKTGVFTGSYAIHPITGKEIPIWIGDYVLATYGTGAVMAVPGHDERDFQFATKYQLPIVRVIKGYDEKDDLPYTGPGTLVNSEGFDGLDWEEGKKAIVNFLKTKNLGEFKINYRLRDWLVSRQRYWGAPIPIIYCDNCGIVPVPEEQLPVLLPYDVDFTPDGKSPLAKHHEFINTTCPTCGKAAKRETDTLDTFVDSSWYYLRYPDNKNEKEPFNKEWLNKMGPVDKYVGGPEHACMHLLYARFIHKALRDMGYIDFDEPFVSLVHQGIILGPDGNRMSKSKGNVISPDGYIESYGSDVFRMYLMFGFAYTEGGPWNDDGIKAIARFFDRIERLIDKFIELKNAGETKDTFDKEEKELNYALNYTIKSVGQDADKFQFNTSIARMMELVNSIYSYISSAKTINLSFLDTTMKKFVTILAPFAPHFSEELWEKLGQDYSVFNQKWPEYDPKALIKDTIELAVQINGKVRGKIEVDSGADEKTIEKLALEDEKVKGYIDGKTIRKVIVIKGKIINIVVS
ncbi:leucyl-tRNA synthetase [Anaerobranca californiensis DSM 14826]|jgi:leucyl-tRNA synthetase|uniref:Leucine--tRNA ligase n=1 Tax=Anaerobranca californiensis DSM 14826 TaxID=1120989 RepID=A0A1M6KZ06_9FIRM|nr:leucine--tRNA ligase [Anaerobranca californiensis]SHJ64114.1 leucyl-tRNA synthetase [Anaerobranca californiensis DSM 14826]